MNTHVKEAIDFWNTELTSLHHKLGEIPNITLLQDAPEIMETDVQWVWTLRVKYSPNINHLFSAIQRWKDWNDWKDYEYVEFDVLTRPHVTELGTIICILHKASIPERKTT